MAATKNTPQPDIDFSDIETDYDREVGGIVYRMAHTYRNDEDGKFQAQVEASFQRLRGKYARAMRVNVGAFKGHWACYVSYANRGE